MRDVETRLRVVRQETPAEPFSAPGGEELGLALTILGLSSIPLVSTIAGLGHWDATSLGLATLGVMFAAHELLGRLHAVRRRASR